MSEKERLEQFILNNKDLENLESLLAQFNVFETLNIVNTEIRHSSVLFWLLQPNANHGCGDYFLRLFLKYIFSSNREYLKGDISIFDLEIFEYGEVEVRREWKNIDLLIVSELNKFVVVVENKISTVEHGNQLNRYFDIVEKEFPKFEKIYVYLTPDGDRASNERWLVFDYGTIVGIIEDLIEYRKTSLNEHILSFLKQYLIILRRYIVSNSEIETICRGIYKKHKQALDLIFSYKPDILSEISLMAQEAIKKYPNLVLDSFSKSYIRFVPKGIDSLIPMKAEGWTKSKRVFLVEMVNYDSKLHANFIIGPGPDALRNKLYEFVGKKPGLFNRSNKRTGQKWTTIHQAHFLKKSNFEDEDFETLEEKFSKKFDSFVNKDLKDIEDYFVLNWK